MKSLSKKEVRKEVIEYRNNKVRKMIKNNPYMIDPMKKLVTAFGLKPNWKDEEKQYLEK